MSVDQPALLQAVALHYEFFEDWCCSPPTYSAECDYRPVCHECGQDWPCDTALVASGEAPRLPSRGVTDGATSNDSAVSS